MSVFFVLADRMPKAPAVPRKVRRVISRMTASYIDMSLQKFNRASDFDGRVLTELRQNVLRNGAVGCNDRHGFQRFTGPERRVAATQRKIGDIDFVETQHASHVADYAGDVQILHEDQVAREWRLAVDL